jgi:hypothetical protein
MVRAFEISFFISPSYNARKLSSLMRNLAFLFETHAFLVKDGREDNLVSWSGREAHG